MHGRWKNIKTHATVSVTDIIVKQTTASLIIRLLAHYDIASKLKPLHSEQSLPANT